MCALSFLIVTARTCSSEVLTLDDCISLAKKGNLTLNQSIQVLKKARSGLIDAYSSYYPSIDLSSGYRNTEGFRGEREGHYSTSLSLQYPVFRGEYVRAGTDIARADVDAAQANYRFAQDEVIFTVQEAFFRILQKQGHSALADNVLARRRQDLAVIRLKYDAGRESSPAVQEAEANVLQAEYEKMKAQEELALARMELNILLGRPREAEMVIRHEDEPVRFPSLESIIEGARSERPEMHVERARRSALEAQVSQAKSSYWPTVSLSGSYGWQGDALLDQEGGWSAGLNISLPIFEGFSRKAKVVHATLSLQEEDLKLQELEDRIEEEVEQAYSNWELAQKNVHVSEMPLEAAREMYQLTRLHYEQGLTSYLSLQQKESSLTQAEYNHANALFNLRTSGARLQRVSGRRNQ